MSSGEAEVPQISDEEIEATFGCPSFYCNKMYLTLSPVLGRLTFAEIRKPGSQPQMRASVALAINDLIELRDLIDRLLEGKVTHISSDQGKQNV